MKISEVQKFIRDRLKADEAVQVAHADVVAADDGDVYAEIDRALAEVGLAVIILAPSWRPTSNSAKCAVGILGVVVRIVEVPATNRAQADFTTGIDLAEHTASLLNLERPFPNGDTLVLDDRGISAAPGPDGATVIWEVPFKMLHQLKG